MATCGVCSAPVSLEEGTYYTADELRLLVSQGFGPPEEIIARARAAGMSRAQVMSRWRQGLAAQEVSGLVLCASCAARASAYLPRPAQTTIPAGPPRHAPSRTRVQPARSWTEERPQVVELPPPKPPPPPRRATDPLPIIMTVAIVIALGMGALILLPSLGYRLPWQAAPVAVAEVATRTPAPTRPPTTPTATPVPDLSTAIITLEDLPDGFEQMSESDLAETGFEPFELSMTEEFSQAQVLNLVAFWNRDPRDFELIYCFLLYPLTELEQTGFDLLIYALATGAEPLLDPATESDLRSQGVMGEMGGFGDESVGLSSVDNSGPIAGRGELVIVRRGPVVEVVVVLFIDRRRPPISSYILTQLLDSRVAKALGDPR